MLAAVRNLPRDKRLAAAYGAPPISADDGRRDQPRHRRAWAQADPRGDCRAQAAGERVNVLTHCNAGWLACVDCGTAPAPIYEAHDRGIAAARMGRRDAAAQSGRGAHGLRARRPRRAAHHHRRQRRRAPDAAGAGGPGASSAPTASPPTATPPTRSAPTSRRWRRRTTACRSMWRCRTRPSIGLWTIGTRHPDRGAQRRRGARHARPHPGRARSCRCEIAAPGSPARNDAFDVTPARLITGLITERGVAAARARVCSRCIRSARARRGRRSTSWKAHLCGEVAGSRLRGDDVGFECIPSQLASLPRSGAQSGNPAARQARAAGSPIASAEGLGFGDDGLRHRGGRTSARIDRDADLPTSPLIPALPRCVLIRVPCPRRDVR